jgi:DNA-binding LytR/AlgR family response regulator
MTIIIIEDEKPAARLLQRKVERLGYQVQCLLHSVEESINWFSKNEQPDLIFIDIQLSDGLSFEIFDQVKIKSAVIFTTAYDQYALQAFKLNSVDYLLKPIDEEDLEQAIEKYKTNFLIANQPTDFEAIKALFQNQNQTKAYKKRFSIKIGEHIKIINTSDIECIFSQDKGTFIHTFENRDYLTDFTMDQMEEYLNPEQFFRINRKFILNLQAVKDIIVYSNSRLKIKTETYKAEDIIVARERVQDFKKWIG